jgi:hypothetical protein
MRYVALALALILIATASSAESDASRPYSGHLPDAAGDHVAVVQVHDAVTGRPLRGVSVRQYDESIEVGFLGARLLAETVTDEFGLASIEWRTRPQDCHFVFDAPGYAVMEEYGSFPPDRVWLLPGEEVEARILDPFGRPAAGVEVELLLGCGHSPAVRRSRTTSEGRFRFTDVEPGSGRVWFRMSGAASDYIYTPPTGRAIAPLPGITIFGIVTDPEGKPVEGVIVASTQTHRGPAVTTGPAGRFVLRGVDPSEGVWFLHESYRGGDSAFLRIGESELPPFGRPAVPIRVVLPPADVEAEDYGEFAAPDAVSVPVRVVDASSGADLPDVPLRLLSAKTGLGVFSEDEIDEETGRMLVRVSPGAHHVLPGDPFAAHRIVSPESVLVEPGRKEPIVAKATPQPVLELVGLPDDPSELWLTLCVPGASVGLEPGDGEPVHLPPEGPAVVRVESESEIRFFPAGPVRDGRRRATIAWAARSPSEPELEGEGPVPGIGPVRLLRADGTPVADRKVRIERRNRASWGETDEDGVFGSRGQSARADGFTSLPERFVAPPFVLEVEGFVSRVVQVDRPGPLSIRYPPGAIEMAVVSDTGEALDFGYCLDAMTGKGSEGRLLVRGVAPGRRKLVIDAPGHAARLLLADVPEAGVKAVSVVLRREE